MFLVPGLEISLLLLSYLSGVRLDLRPYFRAGGVTALRSNDFFAVSDFLRALGVVDLELGVFDLELK